MSTHFVLSASWLSLDLVFLLLSTQYVRADLSRELAVLNMAGHLSIPPQAVRVPFNLTCNFPGEVYKSHKQNFNVVKYLTETVNVSFFMRTGCMATGLRKDEDNFQVICITLLKSLYI